MLLWFFKVFVIWLLLICYYVFFKGFHVVIVVTIPSYHSCCQWPRRWLEDLVAALNASSAKGCVGDRIWMGLKWDWNGVSMGFQLDLLGFQWDFNGTSMGFQWDLVGFLFGFMWLMGFKYVISMGISWDMGSGNLRVCEWQNEFVDLAIKVVSFHSSVYQRVLISWIELGIELDVECNMKGHFSDEASFMNLHY